MSERTIKQFKAARSAAVPIVAINTPDPAATIQTILTGLNGTAPAVVEWDCTAGLRGRNDAGRDACSKSNIDPLATTNPVDACGQLALLPAKTIGFFHQFHRVVGEFGVSQAVWNLRDKFKGDGRMIVLLSPSMALPGELAGDVVVIDEELPGRAELAEIVKAIHGAASAPVPEPPAMEKAIDAVAGIAAFPAEQAIAMSISRKGLDIEGLWERKRTMIRQTPGLSVYGGKETFSDIGGCENVKEFLRDVLRGNSAPRAIVFVDEIEKAFAGTGTDTSGVSTEMTGQILTEMQDQGYIGVMFLGHPGAAKTAVAKAAGNEAGIPTIQFDLGAMKGSLVGESSARLRAALKTVRAVSQGSAAFVATCNSFGSLPPELRRRFTLGTFFFDLPTAEEREAIWRLYCAKYKIGGEIPEDSDWTGAEIRNCVDLAWRLNRKLTDAARFVVPLAQSAPEKIKSLRDFASGKFISAAHGGVYRFDPQARTERRALRLEDE